MRRAWNAMLIERNAPGDGALEPYFAENDRITGVAGETGDPAYPSLGRTGTRFARAMNGLGWHWWPSDIYLATTNYSHHELQLCPSLRTWCQVATRRVR